MPYKDPAKAREAVRKSQAKRRASRTPEERTAEIAGMKEWRRRNADKVALDRAAWKAANPEKHRASVNRSVAQWARKNKAKVCFYAQRRNAAKLKATPPWLDAHQTAQILATYEAAAAQGMHVDHIVPLRGKNVSGLHVPWNLQLLTPFDNMSKGNRCPS